MNHFVEGQDYYGPMPWPEYVSLESLHVDFVLSMDHPITRTKFANKFREVAKVDVAQNMGKTRREVFFITKTYYFVEPLRPKHMLVTE